MQVGVVDDDGCPQPRTLPATGGELAEEMHERQQRHEPRRSEMGTKRLIWRKLRGWRACDVRHLASVDHGPAHHPRRGCQWPSAPCLPRLGARLEHGTAAQGERQSVIVRERRFSRHRRCGRVPLDVFERWNISH